MKMCSVLIVGSGSIGTFLGVKLKKNNEVVLLGRNKLKHTNNTILVGDTVFEMPKKIFFPPKNKSYDFVFITSKLYDLEENIDLLNRSNIQTKYLISIQNSVVDKNIFSRYKYKANLAFLAVFEGYRLVDNQLFVQEGKPGWKINNTKTGVIVARLLQDSGINCTTTNDIEVLKAEKTIMNCSINVLSAVCRKTFYELFLDKKILKRINALFDETYDIMLHHYKLRNKDELRLMFFAHAKLMKHYSSTYQDLLSGHKTEIAFLNELVIDLGKKAGLKTKENQKIVDDFNSQLSELTTLDFNSK